MKIPNFYVWVKNTKQEIMHYNYEEKNFIYNDTALTNLNSFFLPKQYTMTKATRRKNEFSNEEYDEYLKQQLVIYAETLIKDREEFYKDKELKRKFDYFSCSETYKQTHGNNVIRFLELLIPDYDNYEMVYLNEYKWFIKCNNAGMMYLKNEGLYKNCFGYDYKMSYPTDMASLKFEMPTEVGREMKYSYLLPNDKLQYGIYRVKIQCENENFNKIFNYSKHNHYTHYTLKRCLTLQKDFDIKIELIQDGKPNALIYDKKCLKSGSEIFYCWLCRLKHFKQTYPKNTIVKILSSSAWGYLQKLKLLYYNEDEFNKFLESKTFTGDIENTEADYYIKNVKLFSSRTRYDCIDMQEPVYKRPFRLLPFITSFSRAKMMTLINHNNLYDNIIRIQTDSITLDKEFIRNKGKYETFIYDDKISGNIYFKNVNTYKKVNDGENIDDLELEDENEDDEELYF